MRNIKFLIILLALFIPNIVTALEVQTHRDINEMVGKIQTSTGFSLNQYLIDNFKLSKGVEEEILNSLSGIQQRISYWLRDGGEYEDAPPWTIPYLRSLNHFHNPLTEEGFKGNCGGISLCVSSTVWSLMPLGTQSSVSGNYSWYDVRDYYHKALTSSTKTERDTYFAQTFRGVGQLMHLIQDVSVPAHTRNDFHYLYNYEDFAESYVSKYGVPTPTTSHFFNGTINNIASFIDTNQYTQSTPESALPSGNTIGLSEYTNANFFSEDTINNSNFPNPKISDTTTTIVARNFTNTFWNTTYPRQYYLKNCCGETNSGQGYLLSTVDFLHDYRVAQRVNLTQPDIPILDDNVYKDYASLLLPRAVGYSASLLNYFFRGKINMDKDPNNSSQYIIKNESDEYMSGNFTLYYDDVSGNRRYLTSWNKAINAKNASDSVTFTEPTDPLERGKYILVFQGTMGNETGAVVGRVVVIKSNPEGRVLYLTSNNYISVRSSKGDVTFYLPNVINSNETVVAARFDRSDWNVFVIATSKGPSNPPPSPLPPSSITGALWNWRYPPVYSERSNYLHKFQIDENFMKINYLGVIYSDTYANYEMSDSALIYTEPLPNGGSATYITEGFAIYYPDNTNSSVPFKPASGWNWAGKIKTKTIKDIYVDGNIVKPLIEIREAEASNSVSYAGKQLYNGRWVDVWTSAINCNRRTAIVYGESPLNKRVDNIALSHKSGSSLSGLYSSVDETLSSSETSTGEVWYPQLIANQSDIFYTKKEPPDTNTFKLYRSPNTLLLPSHFYSSDIFSYIRKDTGGYSLAFNKSAYSELYSSIGTEEGILSDAMFIGNKDLIGFNIKYTGNWTDWSKSPPKTFRMHSIYLSKINIDPTLPNGYEITNLSPLLANWWDMTHAIKTFDFILNENQTISDIPPNTQPEIPPSVPPEIPTDTVPM